MKKRLQQILEIVCKHPEIHPECDDLSCMRRGNHEICYLRGFPMCMFYHDKEVRPQPPKPGESYKRK